MMFCAARRRVISFRPDITPLFDILCYIYYSWRYATRNAVSIRSRPAAARRLAATHRERKSAATSMRMLRDAASRKQQVAARHSAACFDGWRTNMPQRRLLLLSHPSPRSPPVHAVMLFIASHQPLHFTIDHQRLPIPSAGEAIYRDSLREQRGTAGARCAQREQPVTRHHDAMLSFVLPLLMPRHNQAETSHESASPMR